MTLPIDLVAVLTYFVHGHVGFVLFVNRLTN